MSKNVHRFLTSGGLMPSTVFDKGNTDMDISEEMEEIRELLYELIKKKFPMGVSSSHLAEKYYEEYVSKGLGRELPSDWLEQVTAAEEFETQIRGPLTILFVRLSNTNSFKRPSISLTNIRVISSNNAISSFADHEIVKKGLNRYALEYGEKISSKSPSLSPKCDVHVVTFESAQELYIRSLEDDKIFEKLKLELSKYYINGDEENCVQIHEVYLGAAYALRDAVGEYFRIIVEDISTNGLIHCYFCDVGIRNAFPISDLRLLPDPTHFSTQVCSLAMKVSLNIPQKNKGLDNILEGILFNKDSLGNMVPVRLQLASLSENKNGATADLWTMDGQGLIDIAIGRMAYVKENTNTIISLPSSVISIPLSCCSFDDIAEIHPMAVAQMPTSPFHANALFASGPADISLRQVSLDPMPDYMYNKLAEECELPQSRLLGSPQPGNFYAAKIDGRWERVHCLRASKIDKAAFCVYLIDVGAFHYVRGEGMRRLNAKTPFRKMLMFKCKVAGIVPIGGQDVWTRESHDAVCEYFEAGMGEPIQVHPSICGWSNWKQLNAPAVPLVEARLSCYGRDLGDWLISCGLALPDKFCGVA